MFVNNPTLPGPRKKLPRPVCHLLVLLSLDNSLLSLVPRVLKVSRFFINHKIVMLILMAGLFLLLFETYFSCFSISRCPGPHIFNESVAKFKEKGCGEIIIITPLPSSQFLIIILIKNAQKQIQHIF